MSFAAAYGTFATSHVAECPDVAPECATETIPPHLHNVRLGLTHYETQADYGLRPRMQLSVRLPYDIKSMHVGYATLEGRPFTPPYGDIHHRTERLSGISDPSVGLEWSPRPGWQLGFGTTLPVGRTEPDPVELGREGKTHEHIQFGSGTFQPRLALQWMRPGPVTLFARAETKLSLYENAHGYRAPQTFLWSAGPSFRAGRLTIAPRLTGQHQTLGRWSGEVDEGSGFDNGGIRLQLSVPWKALTVAPGVYRELWSRGLAEQTFRQGTTWSLALARTF